MQSHLQRISHWQYAVHFETNIHDTVSLFSWSEVGSWWNTEILEPKDGQIILQHELY
jgi:hypothetical protein